MAFESKLLVLTQPGATGNQTYNLPNGFDPKAVILRATPQTADGSIASYSFGMGFGTFRGGAVQQCQAAIKGLDAAGSADTGRLCGTGALLRLQTMSAGSTTIDLEIDLVSMADGSPATVTLNWVNLHTTASIRVFMLVLGGDSISDAQVGTFAVTTAAATQDVTVASGFGQPEMLWFLNLGDAASFETAVAVDAIFSHGLAKQGEAGRCFAFGQTDGNTNSITQVSQRSDRIDIAFPAGSGAAESIAQLDTNVANWPTDGFEVDYDSTPSFGNTIGYLALRTDAEIATGSDGALTAGADQDDDVGFTPKLAYLFGWNLAASASVQTAAADQVGFGVGAFDGTDENWCGFTEDDAIGTMDSNSQQVDDKIVRNYNQAAALQSEADASFTGTIFRRTWVDLDTVAREHQWVVIGDEVVASAFVPRVMHHVQS